MEFKCKSRTQVLTGEPPKQMILNINRQVHTSNYSGTSIEESSVTTPLKTEDSKNKEIYFYHYSSEGKLTKVFGEIEAESTHTGGWHWTARTNLKNRKKLIMIPN